MLEHLINVTEFWETDPNHTFIFDYISHHHMNSNIPPKILCGLQNRNYLQHQRNTLETCLQYVKYL